MTNPVDEKLTDLIEKLKNVEPIALFGNWFRVDLYVDGERLGYMGLFSRWMLVIRDAPVYFQNCFKGNKKIWRECQSEFYVKVDSLSRSCHLDPLDSSPVIVEESPNAGFKRIKFEDGTYLSVVDVGIARGGLVTGDTYWGHPTTRLDVKLVYFES